SCRAFPAFGEPLRHHSNDPYLFLCLALLHRARLPRFSLHARALLHRARFPRFSLRARALLHRACLPRFSLRARALLHRSGRGSGA
ncbi:MAG: hypothetical protein J6I36_06405, partial [Bacteroidaceae bacterium]|nr:hypothetical protein [Bacteroidaceae bacterium]